MTDFYSVLRKAVDGLADNNAAARKALYARAEAALVAQLQNAEGDTPEAQIEEVRKSLQQAAQRIEGEEAVKEAVATPAPPVTTATTTQPYVSPLRQRLARPGDAAGGAELPPATPPQAPFAVPPGTQEPSFQAASEPQQQPAPVAAAEPAPSPEQPQQPFQPNEAGPAPTPTAAPAGVVPPAAVTPSPPPATFTPPPATPSPTTAPAAPAPPPAPAAAAPPPPPPPPPPSPAAATDPQQAAPGFAPDMSAQQASPSPHDWPEGTAYVPEPPRRRWGLLITLLALAGLAGLGYWQREVVLETIEPIIAIVNPGGQDADKIEERLSTPDGETPAPEPVPAAPAAPATAEPAVPPAPAVIEALLIEESGQEGVAPTQVAGSVNWALRQQDGSPYIEGLVQIPERGLTLTINIFRNRDPDFPATHTIDFFFQSAANASPERVENVPGLLVKETPRAAGGPLAGEVVKVDDGVFLMALHSRNPDAETNRIRLREQPFFDVPVVYASGKRAIITLAKGTEGQTVFQQAFDSWAQ